MIKVKLHIQVEAPTKDIANKKKSFLEQLSKLDLESLSILADKSNKSGIANKLKQFQHLI